MNRHRMAILVATGLVVWTEPLSAQQVATPVIGFLTTASASSRTGEPFISFHRGLREGGFVENENVKIEYRWADNDYSRLAKLAEELVHLRVKVIVAAGGHVSALAAHKATKEIPIAFTTVTDPVKDGLVASFNKPGGNATGTAGLTSELDSKRLELLRELLPSANAVGVLVNPKRPGVETQSQELQAAADKLNIKVHFQKAGRPDAIDEAFAFFVKEKVGALIVTADPFFNNRRAQVVALATKFSIPSVYQWQQFVSAGGLMSYGPSITEAYQLAGLNAARMLKGTKPADIPVVQPTRFKLVINRKAANALGLTIPPSLLVRADEIIE